MKDKIKMWERDRQKKTIKVKRRKGGRGKGLDRRRKHDKDETK